MTSPIKDRMMIHVHVKSSTKNDSLSRNKSWNGYDVSIIKDCDDALRELKKVLSKKRNIFSNENHALFDLDIHEGLHEFKY